MKKVFAIVLVLVMMTTTLSVNAAQAPIEKCQFSKDLEKRLLSMDDDDTVSVAIWFKDVNEAELEKSVADSLKKAVDRDIISTDYNSDVSVMAEVAKNKGLENQFIQLTRSATSTYITEYNNNIVEKSLKAVCGEMDVTYIDTYAPMVIANLKKDEIEKISTLTNIDTLFYCGEEIFEVYDEPVLSNKTKTALENNDKSICSYDYGYWQSTTNIGTVRDAQGVSGAGVNIGLICTAYPDMSNEAFNFINSSGRYHALFSTISGTSDYATYLASILVGYTSGYRGIVPNASLYALPFNNSSNANFFQSAAMLASVGVLIIDVGVQFGSKGATYDITSQYIDYLTNTYNVVFCLPVGDKYTSSDTYNICNSAMAYNGISVGNIDDHNTLAITDDTIKSNSLYTSPTNSVFKPEICAPGTNVKTYTHQYTYYDSTVVAATVVSGVCAQIMNKDTTAKYQPMRVKSIVTSSSNKLDSMTSAYSTTTDSSLVFDREYGAGLIDSYGAYYISNNAQYLDITAGYEFTPGSYSLYMNVRNQDISYNRDVSICLDWIQKCTYDGMNYSSNYTPFNHTLKLYNPSGVLVASSDYNLDRKEYIYYHPTVSGNYRIEVSLSSGTIPANYNDKCSVSYYITD